MKPMTHSGDEQKKVHIDSIEHPMNYVPKCTVAQ